MTGNSQNKGDWSESVLKVDPGLNKNVLSFFTPSDKDTLNGLDFDLGSGGLLLIQGTNYVVGGGKAHILYLMNRDGLGGYNVVNKVLDSLDVANAPGEQPGIFHHIHGSPAYYNGPNGPRLYVWPEAAYPKAITFTGGSLKIVSIGTLTDPDGVPGGSNGMPGGFLSVSSNGTAAGTGILWANHPWSGDANQDVRSGVLRAFDPYDLTRVLWHSHQNPMRDDFGNFAKFCCPTILGGRVYQTTMGGLQSKQTSSIDRTQVAPAFANQNNNQLAVAFLGPDGSLRVNTSPDGLFWNNSTKVVIPTERSSSSPGLAFHPSGTTYMGWVDINGNNTITIMQTSSTGLNTWDFRRRTVEQSITGVSLVCSDGQLIVAWTSPGSPGNLNVATTVDGGNRWKTKVTLSETSRNKPSLVMNGGMLVLTWMGPDGRLNIMTCSDINSLNFGNKITLSALASFGPALDFDSNGLPWLVWNRTGSQARLTSMTADEPNVAVFLNLGTRVRTFQDDASSSGPAFCRFKGRMIMAWGDSSQVLNYAVVSRGGVAVYGLLGGAINENASSNGKVISRAGRTREGCSGEETPA